MYSRGEGGGGLLFGLHVVGSVSVLLEAKARGLVDKLQPFLPDLRA